MTFTNREEIVFMRKRSVWQWHCSLHIDEHVPYGKTVIKKKV